MGAYLNQNTGVTVTDTATQVIGPLDVQQSNGSKEATIVIQNTGSSALSDVSIRCKPVPDGPTIELAAAGKLTRAESFIINNSEVTIDQVAAGSTGFVQMYISQCYDLEIYAQTAATQTTTINIYVNFHSYI